MNIRPLIVFIVAALATLVYAGGSGWLYLDQNETYVYSETALSTGIRYDTLTFGASGASIEGKSEGGARYRLTSEFVLAFACSSSVSSSDSQAFITPRWIIGGHYVDPWQSSSDSCSLEPRVAAGKWVGSAVRLVVMTDSLLVATHVVNAGGVTASLSYATTRRE